MVTLSPWACVRCSVWGWCSHPSGWPACPPSAPGPPCTAIPRQLKAHSYKLSPYHFWHLRIAETWLSFYEKSFIMHCNENPTYVFLFWELRGLSPNFHIHVSVSNLHIPRIGPHIWLQQYRQTDPINPSQIYECRNWEREHYYSVLKIKRLHSFISGNT